MVPQVYPSLPKVTHNYPSFLKVPQGYACLKLTKSLHAVPKACMQLSVMKACMKLCKLACSYSQESINSFKSLWADFSINNASIMQFNSKSNTQDEFWIKSFHLAARFMGLNVLLMEKPPPKDSTKFILSWLYISFHTVTSGMQFPKFSISLHAVPCACLELACSSIKFQSVWAAHKNFAVLVILYTFRWNKILQTSLFLAIAVP